MQFINPPIGLMVLVGYRVAALRWSPHYRSLGLGVGLCRLHITRRYAGT
ncbi:MAG TPA: hypothetical protein PLA12_12640 [Candidatus Hydrogenedens sp.]|nr:hypothetical protein [Candidatus Hydrogenedens sp.]